MSLAELVLAPFSAFERGVAADSSDIDARLGLAFSWSWVELARSNRMTLDRATSASESGASESTRVVTAVEASSMAYKRSGSTERERERVERLTGG